MTGVDDPVTAVRANDVFCLHPTPRGHVAALRGLTLEVAAGERVVIHGPNGSGKTTLMRVLLGEVAPSAGRVRVCGVDLVGASERVRTVLRRRRIGVVDQHHGRSLQPELTVLENVALQLRLGGIAAAAARSRAVGMLDRLGLSTLARRRPVTLSGGEAQRVAICAAVAHGPDLILADEPTGELDQNSADEVYDLLSEAARACGSALLIVSHDERAARIGDRIVRIRDGRLSEEWRPTAGVGEWLVIDDRGWVRLPEHLRHHSGVVERAQAVASGQSIVLTAPAAGPRPAGSEDGPPSPPPAVRSPVAPGDGVVLAAEPVVRGGGVVAAAEPVVRGGGVVAAAEVAGRGDGAVAAVEPVALLAGVRLDRDRRQVLDTVDLAVRPGLVTVVRGRSGSGKTSLLRLLCGLDRPDAGSVVVGGQDLAVLDRAGLAALRRRRFGVVGQSTALMETMDVEENLDVSRLARRLGTDSALVDEVIRELDLGAVRHRAVRLLSGGERQRVALARVLVVGPDIAVLDEPTSRQDEAHAGLVVDAVVGLARRGAAVVAATHDPVLAAVADEVIDLS